MFANPTRSAAAPTANMLIVGWSVYQWSILVRDPCPRCGVTLVDDSVIPPHPSTHTPGHT